MQRSIEVDQVYLECLALFSIYVVSGVATSMLTSQWLVYSVFLCLVWLSFARAESAIWQRTDAAQDTPSEEASV